jgi:hypothetical protein
MFRYPESCRAPCAAMFLSLPPAPAVGRVGRSEAEDGVGGLSATELDETPPTRHLVRYAHEAPPSPPLTRGDKEAGRWD